MSVRRATAERLARLTGTVSRLTRQGGGTTLPGHVFMRIAPNDLGTLAGRLEDGVVTISATNGKTTTAAMLTTILAHDTTVCRNAAGANLVSGIATALVHCPADARVGVLEVDEAALPIVAASVQPRVMVLGNLFRDQLDRHGELELVADRWRTMVAGLDPQVTLVLGADDPAIDALAGTRGQIIRFGIDDPAVALPSRDAAADSTFCVHCGAAYRYDAMYLGHLGAYSCPRGDHQRGTLDFAARAVRLDGVRGSVFRLDAPDGSSQVVLPLPGLYNVENALAAIAAAFALGVPSALAGQRLAAFAAAFGRFERIAIDGREAVLLLIKNPTGANEALRAIATDLTGKQVVMALNDGVADGRDVSWIWDIDLEGLLDPAAGVICSGTRAVELELRLRYADLDDARVGRVVDVEMALAAAIEATRDGGEVYVLATYTAMLDLQRALTRRGLTQPYWESQR